MNISSNRHSRLMYPLLGAIVAWSTALPAKAQPILPLLKIFPYNGGPVDGVAPGDPDGTQNNMILRPPTLAPLQVPYLNFLLPPDSPLTFYGDVMCSYTAPTSTSGGSVTFKITNAAIRNPTSSRVTIGSHPSFPTDYPNALTFVTVEHDPLIGLGNVSINVTGSLQGLFATTPSSTPQELHLGVSDTTFTSIIPGPPDFAYARQFFSPPYGSGPAPLNASGSMFGAFAGGNGILQLHIDDAISLGPGDEFYFPNSIEITATGFSVPEPSGLALLAGVLIAAVRVRPKR
jgi:hypothetical protein